MSRRKKLTPASLASARYRAKKKAQGWVDFSCFVPFAIRPQINRTIKRAIMVWRAKQAASDNNTSKKVK